MTQLNWLLIFFIFTLLPKGTSESLLLLFIIINFLHIKIFKLYNYRQFIHRMLMNTSATHLNSSLSFISSGMNRVFYPSLLALPPLIINPQSLIMPNEFAYYFYRLITLFLLIYCRFTDMFIYYYCYWYFFCFCN